MKIRIAAISMIVAIAFAASPLFAQQTVTRGSDLAADIARDGRIAIDLAGEIWVVPAGGGKAHRITDKLKSARRPRWSPEGLRIAYEAESQGSAGLFIYDFASGESHTVSRGGSFDMHAAWHPGGERLVYASDATGDGFDLWEVDLPSGLRWRLSNHDGAEIDAAWSADGRDLVYVRRHDQQWSLILRTQGMPEETLLSSTDRIAAPSWRPDGSLITFLRQRDFNTSMDMVILSQPRLIKSLADGEAFGNSAVSWLDRHRMLYTADGELRQRLFNSWSSSPLPFEATLSVEEPASLAATIERRPLPHIDEPSGRLVVRAARLYDGLGGGYQIDRDIVMDGGRIVALEAHRDRPGTVQIDMGDLTVLPGFIDVRGDLSLLSKRLGDRVGPLLLASGVTSVVAELADSQRLDTLWSGKQLPGPRLLSRSHWPLAGIRSMADATTPGLAALLRSRQGVLSNFTAPVARRFWAPPDLTGSASATVASSYGNGLPAGIGLHAELLALSAAGLTPEQALKAAGVNAAAALKLDPLLGRIAVGAVADLVLIDGDPLANIGDALKIVAVVRNGRFFSVGGLIDRVSEAGSVE